MQRYTIVRELFEKQLPFNITSNYLRNEELRIFVLKPSIFLIYIYIFEVYDSEASDCILLKVSTTIKLFKSSLKKLIKIWWPKYSWWYRLPLRQIVPISCCYEFPTPPSKWSILILLRYQLFPKINLVLHRASVHL